MAHNRIKENILEYIASMQGVVWCLLGSLFSVPLAVSVYVIVHSVRMYFSLWIVVKSLEVPAPGTEVS